MKHILFGECATGSDANGRAVDSLDLIRRLDTLVTAKVFAPDPVTRANAPYGGSYVDGNDSNLAVLDSLRQPVSLRLTWNGSGFVLANAAASIQEFDPPTVPVPVLSNANAAFSRSAPEFEMVNALFHFARMEAAHGFPWLWGHGPLLDSG